MSDMKASHGAKHSRPLIFSKDKIIPHYKLFEICQVLKDYIRKQSEKSCEIVNIQI